MKARFAAPQLRRFMLAQSAADFADWLDYMAIAALQMLTTLPAVALHRRTARQC